MKPYFRSFLPGAISIALWLGPGPAAPAALLESLESFSDSVSLVGPGSDTEDRYQTDGPKELVTADFDKDGQPDLAASKVMGRVAVTFGLGGKQFAFPLFLDPPEETGELRGITSGDFDGDGLPDIAVAAPMSGRVVLFTAIEGRQFGPPTTIETWPGARNLTAADIDGDGRTDLVVAGPERETDPT